MTLVSYVLGTAIWDQAAIKTCDRVTLGLMNSVAKPTLHGLDFITYELSLEIVREVVQKMDIT
jgi:hypothetical protein